MEEQENSYELYNENAGAEWSQFGTVTLLSTQNCSCSEALDMFLRYLFIYFPDMFSILMKTRMGKEKLVSSLRTSYSLSMNAVIDIHRL